MLHIYYIMIIITIVIILSSWLLFKMSRRRNYLRAHNKLLVYGIPCKVFSNWEFRNCTQSPLFKHTNLIWKHIKLFTCFSPVKAGNKEEEISRSFSVELVDAQASEIGNEVFVEEQESSSDLSCLIGDLDLMDNNFL